MTTFHSNIISIYGEKGKAWLNELPELVTTISSKHGLRDLIEVTNLTYNYVLSGKNQNNPIYSTLMLKANVSEYLSVLKDKIPNKQSKALDEALALHQDYSLNDLYKNLNLMANSAVCIVDTGLKENFYSQMTGLADAIDFIEASEFRSIIGLV